MTDRRLTPANARVAASHLRGSVTADTYVDGTKASIAVPVTDLCRAPAGPRDRQLQLGAVVTVYETHDGWAFVQNAYDGYVGYVTALALTSPTTPTHRVATRATHAYDTESFKSRDLAHLSFGAKVTVTDERHKFFETPHGFISKKHLRPLDRPFTDPATIAQLYYGTPYLWGGNSTLGIDCSGLVQAALAACDIYCPADSDMQRRETGTLLADDAVLQRGDLIFWKGHIAMMVDETTLIHANAHHMAVTYEPLADATLRIATQGDGPITARKRP